MENDVLKFEERAKESIIAYAKKYKDYYVDFEYLRQYRTKIVCELRRQIFRQIVSKRRRNTCVFQGVLVQDDGKDASKACVKPLGGLCAVLP